MPKWSEAFRAKIEELTGATEFSYRIAVTRLHGDGASWSTNSTIASNLPGCQIGFLPLETMWKLMLRELTTTPAASDIGRLAQLLKAAGLTAPKQVAQPSGPKKGSAAYDQDVAEADTSTLAL